MAGSRSTEAETRLRVAKVADLLLKGFSRDDLCQYVRENTTWQVSESTIDRYVFKARKSINEQTQTNTKESYALAIARYELIWKKALEEENLTLALRTLQAMTKLQGLDTYASYHTDDVDKDMLYDLVGMFGRNNNLSQILEGQPGLQKEDDL